MSQARAIAVTGIGLVTPLGFGAADSWAALLAGKSGVRPITRFATDNLKTRFAASVRRAAASSSCLLVLGCGSRHSQHARAAAAAGSRCEW